MDYFVEGASAASRQNKEMPDPVHLFKINISVQPPAGTEMCFYEGKPRTGER